MIIALYRLSYSVGDTGRARTCDHDLKWENLREYEKPLVRSTRVVNWDIVYKCCPRSMPVSGVGPREPSHWCAQIFGGA